MKKPAHAAPASATLVPLASCFREDHEIACSFPAQLDGNPVVVTAILDRTAVYHALASSERFLAVHGRFAVDASILKYIRLPEALIQKARAGKRGRNISLGHVFDS